MTHPLSRGRFVAVAVGLVLSGVAVVATAPASTATHRVRPPRTSTTTTRPTSTVFTPPTNLRVRTVSSTSVTFEWDHAQTPTTTCVPLAIFLYEVYQDGTFLGYTYLGSPVAAASGLQPGRAYRFTVRGRDNCSGAYTPMSEPLVVVTLA
jgi:hypothetical protein